MLKLFLAVLAVSILSCKTKKIAEPVMVSEYYSFSTGVSPTSVITGNYLSGMLHTLNETSRAQARQNNNDSVDKWVATDSLANTNAPAYPIAEFDDLSFFAVYNADTLRKISKDIMGAKSDIQSQINDIDFNRFFALVFVHPPNFDNIVYNDFLEDLSTDKEARYKYSFVGYNMSSTINVISRWRSTVYKIEKGNRNKITIELNNNDISFDIR